MSYTYGYIVLDCILYDFEVNVGVNMTGKEFKAIRMYNQISQEDVAFLIDRNSRHTVARMEKRPIVTQKYVKALSQLTGINLFDEKNVNNIYESIPEKYKITKTRPQKGMFYGAETRRPVPKWHKDVKNE